MTTSGRVKDDDGESIRTGLTGKRRCCRRVSWRCGTELLWLADCWAAETDVMCAWTSAAVNTTHTYTTHMSQHHMTWAVLKELNSPYWEEASRYETCYWIWSWEREIVQFQSTSKTPFTIIQEYPRCPSETLSVCLNSLFFKKWTD